MDEKLKVSKVRGSFFLVLCFVSNYLSAIGVVRCFFVRFCVTYFCCFVTGSTLLLLVFCSDGCAC